MTDATLANKPKPAPAVAGTHLVVTGKQYIFRNVTPFEFEICCKVSSAALPPREQEFSYRYRNRKDLYNRWTRWWTYPKDQIIYDMKEDDMMELEHKIETMKVAVVDIETTGLQPDVDLIVEIAVVELNLSDGSTKVLFNEIIKEFNFNESCQNAWVFKNSSLTFDEVMTKGKDLDDIRLDLQIIFDSYYLTAFNSVFDIGFLRTRGFAMPRTTPCIMKSATPIVKIEDYRGRYKWPSVDEAWKFFCPTDIYKEQHRAADDAVHEARILYKMYKDGQYIIEMGGE